MLYGKQYVFLCSLAACLPAATTITALSSCGLVLSRISFTFKRECKLRETFTGGVPTEDGVETIIKEVDSDTDVLRPVPQETLDLFSSPENSPENH